MCNRTGAALGRGAKLDGAYWRRHARQPVEFAKGVATLAQLGCAVLIEVGPQPILTAAALRAWPDTAPAPRAIASMRRSGADHRQIIEALANAYAAGHLPNFGALLHGSANKLDLPTYPFQHKQFWFRDKSVRSSRSEAERTPTVQLLEDGRIDELTALLGGTPGTADVLNKLAAQHNRQRGAKSIADARYEIRWDRAAAGADSGDSSWLLIGDDDAVLTPIAEALAAQGHRHSVLGLPVSAEDEEGLEAALRAAAEQDPSLRILHVAALEGERTPSMKSLLRVQHRIIGGTQRLFRAAAAAEVRAPIWVVTHGAQRVTDSDAVSPEQSSLWGFCRAAALEYPQVWGGVADVAGAQWSQLISSITSAVRGEDQIAVREDATYVPRLVRSTEKPGAKTIELRSDATYLVTGGLGSIGLEIAGYLAAHGARNLVLTSRRTPDEATQKRINALAEQYGCQVRAVTADVADPHDVARLLATVAAELPPLAGIVHAAGENSTTPLSSLESAEIDRVFSGKVWGAWYLSEAAADLKLDFFLSTSSISAVWGSYGQTAYSAANAFLDGLTWRLRQQGIPAFSVNFGPWSAGMADPDARAQLDRRGVRTLSPADALAGMADVLSAGPEGVVARIDWAKFLPIYLQAGARSLLAEVGREVPDAVTAAAGPSGNTRLVEQLIAAPVQQRRKLVLDFLRDVVADVTQIDVSEIREEVGFFDLGMDSLMAVELRRRMEQAFGKEIPATVVMDHPRLVDVADYLLSDILSLGEKSGTKAATQQASLASAAADEPIAIISVACRFPGSPDPDAYWNVLSGGVDAIREIPEDRFDVDEYYDPDQQTPGKIYTRSGGYLESVDTFDPEFFGISPREATWIDPQQRLMLEIAWEGLERAGVVARQPNWCVRRCRRQRVLAPAVERFGGESRTALHHR